MIVHLLLRESLSACVILFPTHGVMCWSAIYVIVAFPDYTHLQLSYILQCSTLNEVDAYSLHTR